MHSHWLVNSFALFGVPYMVFDIYTMYLSHFHTERSRDGSEAPSGHSLQTVRAFLRKDWMLVLHHMALVFIFTPITLVRSVRKQSYSFSRTSAVTDFHSFEKFVTDLKSITLSEILLMF